MSFARLAGSLEGTSEDAVARASRSFSRTLSRLLSPVFWTEEALEGSAFTVALADGAVSLAGGEESPAVRAEGEDSVLAEL